MKSTWIEGGAKRRQSNSPIQAATTASADGTPGTKMCHPRHNAGICKIGTSKSKKNSSGGYKPVARALNVAAQMQIVATGEMSYHDFVHFNYGPESKRSNSTSGTPGEA